MRGLAAAFLAASVLAVPADARADGLLDDYLALQVGSFTSEAQSRQDSRYGVAIWHFAEIWKGAGGSPDERWMYTESWFGDAERPYMQRISRLSATTDGAITARRYAIREAGRFVGAWKEPGRFAGLSPEDLTELEGCETIFARTGVDRFEGGTIGARCRNAYKGATYAVSQATLTPEGMTNWDRGFTARGELAWGPAAGGYRFRRTEETDACVDPVRMLVFGTIDDRERIRDYVRAMADSGLYPATGGWYEALTPPLEVFEGSPPDTRGVAIVRFPCLQAARRFWHSPEYEEIRKLREGIAEFEVLVLPAPRLPAWAD